MVEMYNKYKIGLKTDPCETRQFRSLRMDLTPSELFLCCESICMLNGDILPSYC